MRALIPFATAVAMVIAPCQASASVKAGIEAWQKADYSTAVSLWRPLAEKGDPDAAFNLGQAYRLGRGVAIDLGTAQTWLDRAARKGHVDAQTTLGLLPFQNGNRTGGLRWLRQAADQGEARALLVYGTALFNGDGVARDPVLAYAYVSRSAAQGLPPAKATLAEMDRVLPVEQRRKGIAIALAKAKPVAVAAAAKSAPASKAETAPPQAMTGNWRVQLGAFAQRSSAEALFKRLSLAGPLAGRKAVLIPVGTMTRLQAGPFASRAAAAAACASLSAKGQACFPVAAK